MQVHEVMTRIVPTARPGEDVRDAAARMRDGRVGALPVVGGGRLVGIITDRDIALRYVPERSASVERTVANCMSGGVLHCRDTLGVEEAAVIMADNQIRRLPVLDAGGAIVGLLSVDDIAENASEHLAGETLGEIVETR